MDEEKGFMDVWTGGYGGKWMYAWMGHMSVINGLIQS